MKIIPPITITEAMITASSIPEPDAGETLWNPATNYATEAIVIRTTTHRKYKNAIAGVDAGLPEATPARWQDIGPTNRHAAFDQNRSTPSVDSSPLSYTITPGKRFDSLCLFRPLADSVTITITSGATASVNQTIALRTRSTNSWYSWLTGQFVQRPSVVLLNIPPISNNVVTITLNRANGNCELGEFILGLGVYVGAVQYQARDDAENFSKITRGINGELVVDPKRNVPRNKLTLFTPKGIINQVRALRDALNAKPAVYLGLENDSEDYFEALAKLGIARVWGHGLDHYDQFVIDMEVEEL